MRVLLVGGADLLDVVAGKNAGGNKLALGLAERIAQEFEGKYSIELETRPGAPVSGMIEHLASVKSDAPDVVILSFFADLLANGRLDIDAFRDEAREVCKFLKEAGSYVLIANVCTFHREDTTTNYFTVPADTPSLRAHKVAASILDLSHELGISVIDADRLLAEVGAFNHVESLGHYSAEASGLVCDEILRILTDYGFFEERPLMAQAGARQR